MSGHEEAEDTPSISNAFQEMQDQGAQKSIIRDDAKANAYLMNLRAWVERNNMLGGAFKDNLFGLKGAKLGSLEQGVQFAASGLRAAFNYKNPMIILQNMFNIGMVAWKIGLERRNLENYTAKVNGIGGALLAHTKTGIDMFNAREEAPRWSDGSEVRFKDFDRAMVALGNGGAKVIPDGYKPTEKDEIPNKPVIPQGFTPAL